MLKPKQVEFVNESEVMSGGAFTGIGVGGPSTNGFAYSIYMEPRNDLGFKPNELCTDYYVQVGSRVRGKIYKDLKVPINAEDCEIGNNVEGISYNNPNSKYTGIVKRIIKSKNGDIEAIQILTNTARQVYISPDNLSLIVHKDDTYTGMVERIVQNADSSVRAVQILSKKSRHLYLSPDDLILLVPKTIESKPKYTVAPNYMVGGQLY